MTPEEMERLIRAALHAGIHEIDLSGPAMGLRLRLDQAAPAAPDPEPPRFAAAPAEARAVRAPGVGLFRHRHPLAGHAPTEPGRSVAPGQTIGFLDVGSCLRPVTALEAGVIGAPLCEDGTLVGYGTLLYRLT